MIGIRVRTSSVLSQFVKRKNTTSPAPKNKHQYPDAPWDRNVYIVHTLNPLNVAMFDKKM